MANEKIGRCYWLPASIPLTSAANEIQFGVTPEAKTHLNVVAALTNLTVSSVKLRDISGSLQVFSNYMPILSVFGKRDSARPAHYFSPRALPLNFGNRLEVEAKNAAAGAEAAGHVVFLGVPRDEQNVIIENIEGRGHPSSMIVDSAFTGVADQIIPRTSPTLEEDFLIYGAFTDLASAQVRIAGVYAEQWMTDFVPVWALAGRATSELPTLLWPRKYLIPKGTTITIDFKNVGAEASGKLYLVGQKL